jgi:hypothetical protein
MNTVILEEAKELVKPHTLRVFVATKELLDQHLFVLFHYKVHTDCVEIGAKLLIVKGVLLVFVKCGEDGGELALQLFINKPFLEFHYFNDDL